MSVRGFLDGVNWDGKSQGLRCSAVLWWIVSQKWEPKQTLLPLSYNCQTFCHSNETGLNAVSCIFFHDKYICHIRRQSSVLKLSADTTGQAVTQQRICTFAVWKRYWILYSYSWNLSCPQGHTCLSIGGMLTQGVLPSRLCFLATWRCIALPH